MDDKLLKNAVEILVRAAQRGGDDETLISAQKSLVDLFVDDRTSYTLFYELLCAQRSIHAVHKTVQDQRDQDQEAALVAHKDNVNSRLRVGLAAVFSSFRRGLVDGEDVDKLLAGFKMFNVNSDLLPQDEIKHIAAAIEANRKVLADAQEHRSKVDRFLEAHRALMAGS